MFISAKNSTTTFINKQYDCGRIVSEFTATTNNKSLVGGKIMFTTSIILNVIFVIFVILFICIYVSVKKERKKKKIIKEKQFKKNLLVKLDYFINQVELTKSLRDLYILHIKIWANGIKHPNFGPDRYGMFRTNDILMMTPEEVYLGNIWGLWTRPLSVWETYDIDNQKVVIEQYQNILLSNMRAMKQDIENELQKKFKIK